MHHFGFTVLIFFLFSINLTLCFQSQFSVSMETVHGALYCDSPTAIHNVRQKYRLCSRNLGPPRILRTLIVMG
jgi:hypothetical protein